MALGTATYFAIRAESARHDARKNCEPLCSESVVDDVRHKALYSDLSSGVALLSVGTAVLLYVTRPTVFPEESSNKLVGLLQNLRFSASANSALTSSRGHILMIVLLRRLTITLVAGIFLSCSLAVDASALNEGCPTGTKACYGQCVSKDLPQYGCARAGCAPCGLPNATSNCSTSTGACTVAQCAPHFDNCDTNAANGCETNTDESVTFCGGCGSVNNCDLPHRQNVQTSRCGYGVCYVYECEPGYSDCDGTFPNGCEVNLLTEANHCGDCNVACVAPQTCVSGVCQ